MANRRVLAGITGLLAAICIAVAPGVAGAHNGVDHGSDAADSSHGTLEQRRAAVSNTDGTDRLKDDRLRRCQARAKNISGIFTRNIAHIQKHINLFSTVTERTQKFYEAKGKAAANYDELTAAVSSAKSAVQADIDAAKTAIGDGFNCSGDNPKATVQKAKADLEKARQDLQAYRQAAKNLLLAVKQAQRSE